MAIRVSRAEKMARGTKITFYYGCKHRNMIRGHKCDYKKQINEEMLDNAVAEVIRTFVSNKKVAEMMKQNDESSLNS